MSKNLVIVESPAKAKTIEKYLGGDFTVLSSVGHIRSIAKKTKDGTPPIDVKNGFATVYEIDADKKKVITELKKHVKAVGADNVWLATDEDREGEAIAWHLCEVLKLDPAKTKRIVFHEITKDAITEAIAHPRTVDMSLVKAQQARQILDRIVGFELSPVVWQKVPGGKSAGRVQSPAVRLLVEREREINAFEGTAQFKVTAVFLHGEQEFKAELNERFDTEEEAKDFLESLANAEYAVSGITTTPSTRNPAAPFTTSTLQQEANSKLGMGSRATMAAAQKLYQEGKITYMRTDSVNLSGLAIAAAADYIKRLYGHEYSHVRKFKTKSAGAQEAHEAIRPTDMSREAVGGDGSEQKLYDLIRRRTLASQMAPAKTENTTVVITIKRTQRPDIPVSDYLEPELNEAPGTSVKPGAKAGGGRNGRDSLVFTAKGQVITFDGFLRVYNIATKDEDILPPLKSGEVLRAYAIEARQVFNRPPARYTEGSLVKKLEELGIGRPSTYATIINTIQTRGYVERGDSEGAPRDVTVLQLIDGAVEREIQTEKTGSTKGKLVPTPSGELIADFLTNHFEPVVDYGFTAKVEEHFDDIATDKLDRNRMLQGFYTPFHALIDQSGSIDRAKVGESREVGTDPKTGKLIIARFGRFGPMLQLGTTEASEKPQFAPMPRGAKISDITLEQALKAFELPRIVGTTASGEDIKANVGRFGPYIQVGKLFVSIKDHDPREITEAEARELYEAKLKAEAEKTIADWGTVKVLNGRYGPYITDGKVNAKIPKGTEPKDITQQQAKDLLAAAPAKKPRHRSTAKRKTNK